MTHLEARELDKRIIEEARAGKSVGEICQTLGVNQGKCYKALKIAGVPVPRAHSGIRSSPRQAVSVFDILYRLLYTYESQSEIANRVGVCRQRVGWIFSGAKAAGIKFEHRERANGITSGEDKEQSTGEVGGPSMAGTRRGRDNLLAPLPLPIVQGEVPATDSQGSEGE